MSIFGASTPAATFGAGGASATNIFGGGAGGATSATNIFGGGASGASSATNIFGGGASTPAASGASSATNIFGGGASGASSSTNIFGGGGGGGGVSFGQSSQAATFGSGSGGGLFGAKPATASSAATGFGAQSQPSLFGAPQPKPAIGAAGVFGVGATPQRSMFGAPQTAAATSTFGAQSQPSLFGAPAPSAPAQGTGLFGASSTATTPWGAPASAGAAPPAPPAEITMDSKVSELPQHLQTELLAVERHLRDQRMKAARLLGKKGALAAMCKDLESQYAAMAQKGARTRAALELLGAKVETLKAAIRMDHRASESVLIALENGASSAHAMHDGYTSHGYGAAPGWARYDMNLPKITSVGDRSAHVPAEFFARIVRDMEMRANEYKREIDEIADYFRAQGHHLGAVGTLARGTEQTDRFSSNRGARQGAQFAMAGVNGFPNGRAHSRGRSIEEIIRRQYDYFMVVASQIATVYEQVRLLKDQYLESLRMRDPDATNPFEHADLREKAEKERKRFMADKLVSDAMRGTPQQGVLNVAPQSSSTLFGGGFGASGAIPTGGGSTSLFGNSSSLGFGSSTGSAFGAVGGNTPSNSLFGNSGGFGVSSQSGFASAPSGRRLSGGRRKR